MNLNDPFAVSAPSQVEPEHTVITESVDYAAEVSRDSGVTWSQLGSLRYPRYAEATSYAQGAADHNDEIGASLLFRVVERRDTTIVMHHAVPSRWSKPATGTAPIAYVDPSTTVTLALATTAILILINRADKYDLSDSAVSALQDSRPNAKIRNITAPLLVHDEIATAALRASNSGPVFKYAVAVRDALLGR